MTWTPIATAALLAALSGCGPRSSGGGPAPGGTHAAPEAVAPTPDALVGDYDCRFSRGGTDLPPAPCAIRGDGGGLHFEQPGGAIRLAGAVAADEAGFRLDAAITCAAEPCPTSGRDIVFFTQRPGAFAAVVPLPGGELLNIDVVRR
jgi:hypothetical protein